MHQTPPPLPPGKLKYRAHFLLEFFSESAHEFSFFYCYCKMHRTRMTLPNIGTVNANQLEHARLLCPCYISAVVHRTLRLMFAVTMILSFDLNV